MMATWRGGSVRALGVDLGWADGDLANETGVVAADDDGAIVDAGWTVGVDATLAWAHEHASDSTLMFVDAPLLVLNEAGQRLCEKQVGERYGRWKVSANSTNKRSPRLAGTLLRAKLDEASWT